jgi:hypothetical protein
LVQLSKTSAFTTFTSSATSLDNLWLALIVVSFLPDVLLICFDLTAGDMITSDFSDFDDEFFSTYKSFLIELDIFLAGFSSINYYGFGVFTISISSLIEEDSSTFDLLLIMELSTMGSLSSSCYVC